MFNKKWKICRK